MTAHVSFAAAMAPKERSATTVKLQIAGAVLLPLLLLGIWLNSLGFFSAPPG
ncbi:hypothetical protein KBZ18_03080 [Synechococcus sp. Cruz-9H2]|uniref:hypothetical protein n=1 Tax=unclassified Synechococcus TaxID=2626047 RepID=UPI0020CE7281|nr:MULTISPECIES: hypothetical protein [unclassified Synechococcus]MCP9818475.1 hypothetical protein [Synechococcus sp. Cruz-9H2]MCP9842704.1 hypothetical protein [Synechococcus sp. Edmonson 11F2]MCP9855369.1 hypothetical protein [Synechococcus sp. Cruz-9C9]MCP9862384.1 hypothetical protein [Synechococcus sp. Cruz-7E5]MCP9869656.1 hypothetical protein [Synechococcus sp. Cruz-7B9]